MSDMNVDEDYNKTIGAKDAKAKAYLSRCGYKHGGEVKEDVKKGVHQHERHLHKGEKETKLKLKTGGKAEGSKGHSHLGKYARGGAPKNKKGGTTVNVVISPSQQQPQKVPVPIPAGGPPGGAMPPRPPMGGPGIPPPGGAMPPPGGMPPRPGMMNRGGAAKSKTVKASKLPGGAGGGLARIEKAKEYGPKPRNKGGKC